MRKPLRALASYLRAQPVPGAGALLGAGLAGVAGAIVGLVVGLNVYPPTAWFAVFELGIPATVVGGVVGLLAGCVAATVARCRSRGQSAGG